MKIFKALLLAGAMIFSSSAQAQTKNIEGIDFPTSISMNGQKTVLNGGGLRTKLYFLDLYVGALYVQSKTSDAKNVIMADEEMGIRIEIASKLVTQERFIDALEEGFANASAGKSNANDIQKFKNFLKDEFKKGDVISLNYNAGDAVYLSKNDNQIGKFEGLAFKQALFSIWLGDIPAQESLKDEMLGK
ncbi:MAG: Uncharacterised protein [Owenweeksia sp. TMED14]|nr:MAG: Uncharacterised protein [Owenweeksia sp. TMED14]|tara:strand:- start:1580 stop:2146 length:567 start_codon:yes stop_codon:yes gene_type:complete